MNQIVIESEVSPPSPEKRSPVAARLTPEAGWPLELEAVFETAAEAIREITDFDTLAILLRGETTDELRFAYAQGFSQDVVEN